MSDLRKMYSKLNNSKSTSVDKISMRTLNLIKMSTQPIVLNLVNKMIKTGIFPSTLKISKIIPISKGNQLDKFDPATYRPVNLISPLSKIIEKVWVNQINKYLIKNKIIDNNIQRLKYNK